MKKERRRTRANGDGCIFILRNKKSNPFAVRITTGWSTEGKQIFKYLGYYPTKTAAKKALNAYLNAPYDLSTTAITMQDVWDKWADTHKLSEGTFNGYRGVFNRLGRLKNKAFRDVKLVELETAAKNFTPALQKTFRNVMKALYNYGLKHDIVEKNLGDLIEIANLNIKSKEALSDKAIQEFLQGGNDIPIILLYTGMRINELLSLRIENVNLERRIIIAGSKTAAGKNRRIPIHKEIIPILERLMNVNKIYLVTSKFGRKINYANYSSKDWKDITKKYTLHQLRHTFISQAMKLELNREKIKKIVGHSSSVTEDVYTHYQDSDLIEVVDKFHY